MYVLGHDMRIHLLHLNEEQGLEEKGRVIITPPNFRACDQAPIPFSRRARAQPRARRRARSRQTSPYEPGFHRFTVL